jgi:hypothetical protein
MEGPLKKRIRALLQRKSDNGDQFRRVRLSAILRYVSAENAFIDRTSVDPNKSKFRPSQDSVLVLAKPQRS